MYTPPDNAATNDGPCNCNEIARILWGSRGTRLRHVNETGTKGQKLFSAEVNGTGNCEQRPRMCASADPRVLLWLFYGGNGPVDAFRLQPCSV